MRKAVKKMITLPADLAAQAEAIAHDESFGSVVQEALHALIRSRMREEFSGATRILDQGPLR